MKPGFTMAESKGKQRMKRLVDRLQHIEVTILELQDKHYIIEGEIAKLQSEIGHE